MRPGRIHPSATTWSTEHPPVGVRARREDLALLSVPAFLQHRTVLLHGTLYRDLHGDKEIGKFITVYLTPRSAMIATHCHSLPGSPAAVIDRLKHHPHACLRIARSPRLTFPPRASL